MLKLLKYLKPFTVLIITAILLLFVQAMAELALPDYMSNIVNEGIQQGGIENAVPKAIRESQMEKLSVFMSEDEKNEVLSCYELIKSSSNRSNEYIEEYPILSEEAVYILKDVENDYIENINLTMGRAFLVVSGIEKIKEESKDGVINLNGMELPSNTDIFQIFSQMPMEQKSEIIDEMNKEFEELGDSMIIQAATNSIINEYDEIGMDTEKIQSNFILKTGLIMLLITVVGAISTIMVGFLAAKAASGFARNVRRKIFSHVESFSNEEMDKFSTASLITRSTNDITQIQMLMVMMIRMVFYAPIMGIGGVIRALEKSSSMSWIIALAVLVLLGIILIIFSIALPKFKAIQKLVDKLNLITRENLTGMMVIRAFNTQKVEENRFDNANQNLTKTNLFVNRVMAFLFPAMMFIMNGVTLLIVWIGAHQIAESSMQVGDMMAFMQYAMQIIFAFLMLSMMFIMIPRASVSAQRIAEVLEVKPLIKDAKKPKNFDKDAKGQIEFKNVSFRYPGAEEDMLKEISFTAPNGKTTAFIGSTGSGKTTLISMILRFHDVTSGKVLVDGLDVRDVTQHNLRNQIGYVPQKSSLFSGTIESNLKFGKEDATQDDIKKASEISQAMEFISEKPEKFNADISQGGANISGGQKQRLSIARALVKKPKIYIFDDSFSALDFKTDAALRKELMKNMEISTILIVAQRISTIKNADQIIVLDEGRIVGKGTHTELMKNCATYKEIALSQLSKEELA
ncbi:MAG: ABC transporter ATP-binding protein [Eubacteriaceae bacterium]